MSIMFEKKDKEHEDDAHKPEGTEEGKGGNLGSFFLELAKNPGKYIMYGGIAAALIILLTKVKTPSKNKFGVKI